MLGLGSRLPQLWEPVTWVLGHFSFCCSPTKLSPASVSRISSGPALGLPEAVSNRRMVQVFPGDSETSTELVKFSLGTHIKQLLNFIEWFSITTDCCWNQSNGQQRKAFVPLFPPAPPKRCQLEKALFGPHDDLKIEILSSTLIQMILIQAEISYWKTMSKMNKV